MSYYFSKMLEADFAAALVRVRDALKEEGFGVISEILPVFSGKPIFGYKMIAYSSIAIGFLSFSVFVHHMFVAGIDPALQIFFMASTAMRYASNCSSSPGNSPPRFMNRNSLRNKPIPTAPASSAPAASAGNSMFASRSTRSPSSVTAGV